MAELWRHYSGERPGHIQEVMWSQHCRLLATAAETGDRWNEQARKFTAEIVKHKDHVCASAFANSIYLGNGAPLDEHSGVLYP
jgi:hypothetical protein